MHSSTLLLTFASFMVINQKAAGLACPTFTPQMPFDVNRYLGSWYEIFRTDAPFQAGMTCVNATYTNNMNGTIGVWNQAMESNGAYSSIRGIAEPRNPSVPSALSVDFGNPGPKGDYNVLSTDYDNYALVYSCQLIPGRNIKIETVWFLSRTKQYPAKPLFESWKILATMGADLSTLKRTSQDC